MKLVDIFVSTCTRTISYILFYQTITRVLFYKLSNNMIRELPTLTRDRATPSGSIPFSHC